MSDFGTGVRGGGVFQIHLDEGSSHVRRHRFEESVRKSQVEAITKLQAFRGFAGTSVLILVGVATDTARKFRAELAMQKYKVCATCSGVCLFSSVEGVGIHPCMVIHVVLRVQDIDNLYDQM